LEPLRASIQIDHASKVYRDGKPVSIEELATQLREIGKIDNPRVQVHLETEMGANCATVERVRNLFEQYLQCGPLGQCAEGIKDVWREIPLPSGTPPP